MARPLKETKCEEEVNVRGEMRKSHLIPGKKESEAELEGRCPAQKTYVNHGLFQP